MTDDEEVVGCSEWMRAENADFLLIVEMRNQLPDLIAYIDRQAAQIAELEKMNAELEARLGHEQVVTMQNREADEMALDAEALGILTGNLIPALQDLWDLEKEYALRKAAVIRKYRSGKR